MTRRFDGLVEGAGRFTGDLTAPGLLHLVLVRSTVAHARLARVDTSGASGVDGVVAAFTAADLPMAPVRPIHGGPGLGQPPLAVDVVRYAGEPVAAVLGESLAAALDGAAAVEVDYEPLPAVTDADGAAEPGAPLLFPETGSNVVLEIAPDPSAPPLPAGDIAVHVELAFPRVAVAPLEGHAVLAVPESDDRHRLTAWVSTQAPHLARATIAAGLGWPAERVRVVAPRVGGGFGGKAGPDVVEHVVTAAAAVALGRPVRYVESRGDNLVRMQGRGVRLRGELRAQRDGRLLALRVDVTADAGAYPGIGTIEPLKMRLMATGPYRIPAVEFTARSVLTNRAPTGAYRGPGRSEAATLLERLVDRLAAEAGLDPVELRRRNLLHPSAFPYTTPTGMPYDGGDFPRLLDALLAAADHDRLREEQRARRQRGDRRLLGVGVATVVDSTAWASRTEHADVRVERDGRVTVTLATSGAGQEHATAFAGLVAAVLPVGVEHVHVVEGDTDGLPEGFGSSGSRSAQLAGSAVHLAARQIDDAARRVAAELLEAAVEDVVPVAARGYAVRGVPSRVVPFAAVAAWLLDSDPGGARARCTHAQADPTHPGAAHLAVVEVDVETGRVTPLRHVAVTDAGRLLDRASAEGQVVGATVQGMAQALFEEFVHDDAGNPLTTTFADYLVPSAADVAPVESVHVESVSPMNPLGAKGIGEIGMVGAPAAVLNAVVDALAHLGVRHLDPPCTPERVWRAIREAAALR